MLPLTAQCRISGHVASSNWRRDGRHLPNFQPSERGRQEIHSIWRSLQLVARWSNLLALASSGKSFESFLQPIPFGLNTNFLQGFGAVGVSKKYGKRSLARYPIFWCLDKIGSLPNPDPTDTAPWDKNLKRASVHIDHAEEEKRPAYRQQAQEWAGLTVDPKVMIFHCIQ